MSQQPPESPGAYPAPGFPPPGFPPPGQAAPPPTSGRATAALILGILGLILCGPFASIPAIFVGRSAVKEIDASQGRLQGRGMGTAGYVLGVVGTVAAALIVVLVSVLFVFSDSISLSCHSTNDGNSFSFHCN